MASSITCKLYRGDEIRRFTLKPDEVTYETMCQRVDQLFSLTRDGYNLQYKDDEGDVITMSSEDEMAEAVALALALPPPTMRITVKSTKPEVSCAKPTSALPTKPAELPSKPPTQDVPEYSSTSAANLAEAVQNVAKNVAQSLPAVLEPLQSVDYCSVLKKVCEEMPKFAHQLPDEVKKSLNGAQLDVNQTLVDNAAAIHAAVARAKEMGTPCEVGDVSFSIDLGHHPGVTCDKTGMCPIVGPRFHLKGHNYDLCEAEFNKLTSEEQANFERIEPRVLWPPKKATGCKTATGCPASKKEVKEELKQAWKEVKGAWREAQKETWKSAKETWQCERFHPGVTCDKTGMCPIVGPRFHLKGYNYDLCEAEFNKLSAEEQSRFERIEAPMCGVPWKPRCWRQAPGPNNTFCNGQQDQRHCSQKLAARFVTDVSIFDGTQMPAGTPFTKIWRLKNAGDSPWPAGTKILFVGGDQMNAEQILPINNGSKVVMPGEEVDVAVDMVAPGELGRYLGYWRLVGPMGRRRFGQRIWCHIQVVDPSAAEPPHDPSAVEAEISKMMARTSHEEDENDEDDVEEEADLAVNKPAQDQPKTSTVSTSGSSVASSSIVPGMSSVVSTTTSSAVSLHNESISGTVTPADVESKVKMAEDGPVENNEVKTSEETKEEAVNVEQGGTAFKLEQMGFEPKIVALVVDKNEGKAATEEEILELCTRDLVQLSDWDSMLDDLEEMGFGDRDRNKRLIVKHSGSVKRTVKDLVSDGA